jgi:hypothetical protein
MPQVYADRAVHDDHRFDAGEPQPKAQLHVLEAPAFEVFVPSIHPHEVVLPE